VAPIHALRLYHQTAHLLGACTDPASRRRPVVAAIAPLPMEQRTRQIELELRPAPRCLARLRPPQRTNRAPAIGGGGPS
jgi:hypothetical protein